MKPLTAITFNSSAEALSEPIRYVTQSAGIATTCWKLSRAAEVLDDGVVNYDLHCAVDVACCALVC